MTINRNDWISERVEEWAQELYGIPYAKLHVRFQRICYSKTVQDYEDTFLSIQVGRIVRVEGE